MCSKSSELNKHDWMQLVQYAGAYLFTGLWPHFPQHEVAILTLRDACTTLLSAESCADDEQRAGSSMSEMKLKIVEALSLFETVIPKTELCPMVHILLHVPDAIYKWNSVRNYWSFFIERS